MVRFAKVKPNTRWEPVRQFPLTKTLRGLIPQSTKKKGSHRSEIVSEKLCGMFGLVLGYVSSAGGGCGWGLTWGRVYWLTFACIWCR